MFLNDDTIDIEKPDGNVCLFFLQTNFHDFFRPSIFSIIHSRSAQIIKSALSNF